jgi:hypothetical protein
VFSIGAVLVLVLFDYQTYGQDGIAGINQAIQLVRSYLMQGQNRCMPLVPYWD